MDVSVNSMIADNIEEKFGKLSCKTRYNNTFLGMKINFIGRNKVAVSTQHHVEKDLEDFGETLEGNVVNPATSQLFAITS